MMTERLGREDGSALLVTVMFLVLLGLVGLAGLDTVMRDQQVAGYQGRARIAFYAAEAGLAQARQVLEGVGSPDETPALPVGYVGDTSLYPTGAPTFQGDPNVATPIHSVGSKLFTGSGNLASGRPSLVQTLWRIHVQGQTPDGATTRIEATVTALDDEAVGYGG